MTRIVTQNNRRTGIPACLPTEKLRCFCVAADFSPRNLVSAETGGLKPASILKRISSSCRVALTEDLRLVPFFGQPLLAVRGAVLGQQHVDRGVCLDLI